MPATRKRGPVAVEVLDQEETMPDAEPQFNFNASISWTGGKAIPVAQLLTRLEELSQQLRDTAQIDDEEARESIRPVAKDLVSTNLLQHKDKGVRISAIACIVDVFRIFAPDAPFKPGELKEIFKVMITTVIPSLGDVSSPYIAQCLYIIQNLGDVKSIVLLSDVPSADVLMQTLFEQCFDLLSGTSRTDNGESLSKNVEYRLTALLIALVDEGSSLPTDVIEVILAQFLRADPRSLGRSIGKSKKSNQIDERQTTLLLKEAPPAYNMSKNICNTCADKMARYVGIFFSSVIVEVASSLAKSSLHKQGRTLASDSLDENAATGPSEEELQESRKAHTLLRELWRAAPDVLENTIPQLESELSSDNLDLRLLATETVGDMISGIGAAGPPPPSQLYPAAYPSQSLESRQDTNDAYDFLTTPNSPHSFSSLYSHAFQSFLSRKNDKSPQIRCAWVTSIGRIIATSAGGVGLDSDDEKKLLQALSEMLVDADEKVRLAAIIAVGKFSFRDIVQKLGKTGSVSTAGSILYNLADRVKDRKSLVRTEATRLLAKIWGVAAGALANGDEDVTALLAQIPSRIFEAYYINDLEINVLINNVLFESLLPLGYPPSKAKSSEKVNGESGNARGSQEPSSQGLEFDTDKLRTERILVLVRDLEPKARKVFFSKQRDQATAAKYMAAFLKRCEEFNGGVMERGGKEIKSQLGRLIDYYSQTLPEPTKVSADLWKFAKIHDRRSYGLIKFCISTESDYKKVYRAIKELNSRIRDNPAATPSMSETLMTLIYRSSFLIYNKSHVPPIIYFSRAADLSLSNTAHDVLGEISAHSPDIFRIHIKQLCEALQQDTPTAKKRNAEGTANDLKACASFARKFPQEIPKDHNFLKSVESFAIYGTPPKAGKHAITILMNCTEKKAMFTRNILRQCVNQFKYGSDHFLTRLAALGQLMLLGDLTDDEADKVLDIALNNVIAKGRHATEDESYPDWKEEVDEHCEANLLAMKIPVNRLRAVSESDRVKEAAPPIFDLLNRIVSKHGAVSSKISTPKYHMARLRLQAAQLLLKLCSYKQLDPLLLPKDFNQLALVCQDELHQVRSSFIGCVIKYLGQDRLSSRFYAVPFLLAFEPVAEIKEGAATWIKARRAAFARQKDTTMEATFARFLDLLAHHPDIVTDSEGLEESVKYILFYLKTVATEENLALIYHVAQRVKSVQDVIDPSKSEKLYCLSDLAQALVRRFEEVNGWSMQVWPGKIRLPSSIFALLPSHAEAQKIATRQFVPTDFLAGLDDLVRDILRTKKRKPHVDDSSRSSKRRKSSAIKAEGNEKTLPVRKAPKVAKTPKAKKAKASTPDVPSSDRRRSSRHSLQKSYIEQDDSQDEAELEQWNISDEDSNAEGSHSDEERRVSSASRKAKTTVNGHASKAKGKKFAAGRVELSDSSRSGDGVSEPPESEQSE